MDEFSSESSPVLSGCLIVGAVFGVLLLVTLIVLSVFLIIAVV